VGQGGAVAPEVVPVCFPGVEGWSDTRCSYSKMGNIAAEAVPHNMTGERANWQAGDQQT
jgi:hypothetical protein